VSAVPVPVAVPVLRTYLILFQSSFSSTSSPSSLVCSSSYVFSPSSPPPNRALEIEIRDTSAVLCALLDFPVCISSFLSPLVSS
jgi:hypothetical protein